MYSLEVMLQYPLSAFSLGIVFGIFWVVIFFWAGFFSHFFFFFLIFFSELEEIEGDTWARRSTS